MSAIKHIGRIIFLYQTETDPTKKLLMEMVIKEVADQLERKESA